MVADIDKKKIGNVVRKKCIRRTDISLLKDAKIKKNFFKVIKMNLFGHFKDGILRAWDEVCRKNRSMRRNRDMWWGN